MNHFASKILVVAVAALLWTLTQVQIEGQEALEATVRFVHVPAGMAVDPDQIPTATVIVEGPHYRIRRLRSEGLEVEIDCARISSAGLRTATISAASLHLPQQIRLVRAVPSQLRFQLDRTETREVEVTPRFTGSPALGYRVAGYTVDPPQLKISGPEDRVRLMETVETDPIALDGLVGPRSFRTSAWVADPYVRFVDDPTVDVHVRLHSD